MNLNEIRQHVPKWLLLESKEGKNVHIEHLEDLILNAGYRGAEIAFEYLDNLRAMLSNGTGSPVQISQKWDGAPAIICGTDPQDGKFFVGTKSVFAKNPKIIKSRRDITRLYSDNPGLAEKLNYAFTYLKELGIGGVVQGDLLFTQPDLQTYTMELPNGSKEDCYVFTPNTITYAVPIDSAIGARIASAKIGIAFHTTYVGPSLPEMVTRFGADVAGFNRTKNVWFEDTGYEDYTGRVTLTDEENTALSTNIAAGRSTLKKIKQDKFDIIINNQEFSAYIKPFVNARVRSGQGVDDLTAFMKEFSNFYAERKNADIAKLKRGPDSPAAQAKLQDIEDQQTFMAENMNTLLGIMAIYKRVIEIKLATLRKLQQIERLIKTFMKTDDGYRVTNPEGFVAAGRSISFKVGNRKIVVDGAVKLIDRLEFSRENFAGKADWKRTHFGED